MIKLSRFIDRREILFPTEFGFRKLLGIDDALLTLVHGLQPSLDNNFEAMKLSLEFSSAFDWENHDTFLYKLKLTGVGGLIYKSFKNFYLIDVNMSVQC